MKKLALILLVALAACDQLSTEEKLTEAVRQVKSDQLVKDGHIIESLKIDSIKYSIQSIRTFYEDEALHFGNNLVEMWKGNEDMEKSHSDMKQLFPDLQNIEEDSNYFKNIQITERTKKKYDSFLLLSTTADTSIKIYVINYIFNAKTNKRSYNQKETKYLYTKYLKEIMP